MSNSFSSPWGVRGWDTLEYTMGSMQFHIYNYAHNLLMCPWAWHHKIISWGLSVNVSDQRTSPLSNFIHYQWKVSVLIIKHWRLGRILFISVNSDSLFSVGICIKLNQPTYSIDRYPKGHNAKSIVEDSPAIEDRWWYSCDGFEQILEWAQCRTWMVFCLVV